MKRQTILTVVLTASLGAAPSHGFGQARELYPTTSDEVILKRAAEQAKPLWQIPLGPALIEDMQLAGPDRLLVSLRKDFPGLPNLDTVLVDTAKGQVLWRYSRDRLKGQYDCLLILQDLILFRVDRGESASLLALDPQTGAEKWSVGFKGEGVMFIPFIPGGAALAVKQGAATIELTALGLENGRTVWQRSFPAAKGARFAAPRTIDDDILVFHDGLERLSAKDGRTVMVRRDLVFDPAGPPPQIENGVLWAVHSGGRLSAVDAASGKDAWTTTLAGDVDWTNIYPLGEKIYLRGIDAAGSHRLTCLPRGGGQPAWTYSGAEPSVSNLVESGGILYFGTPTSLVALNATDGQPVFSSMVTTTGRAFPIRLRKTDGRIVYIGELVVAAFDARTGQLAYKQGMTPGSPELHLNGLDAATPNLKSELKAALPGSDAARAASSFASREMARYQNLSTTYRAQASSSRSRGDTLGSSMATLKQQQAEHEARLQATAALVYSVLDVVTLIRQVLVARSINTAVDRQELFRKSILSSYAQAEGEEYVFRPHLVFRDIADNFSAISVVHLPTGKRSETILSPSYLSYGLWQVVDFDKGVVYHGNIGLDPSRYELSESRAYYPYNKAKTVHTFLIAQPVKIPR